MSYCRFIVTLSLLALQLCCHRLKPWAYFFEVVLSSDQIWLNGSKLSRYLIELSFLDLNGISQLLICNFEVFNFLYVNGKLLVESIDSVFSWIYLRFFEVLVEHHFTLKSSYFFLVLKNNQFLSIFIVNNFTLQLVQQLILLLNSFLFSFVPGSLSRK